MEKVINNLNGPPDFLGGPVFSICGQTCGQRANIHNGQEKKVVEVVGFGELLEAFTGINLLIPMESYLR